MFRAIKRAIKQKKVYVTKRDKTVRFYIIQKGELVEISQHLKILHDSKAKDLETLEFELNNAKLPDVGGVVLKGGGLDVVAYFLYEIAKKWDKQAKCSGWDYKII